MRVFLSRQSDGKTEFLDPVESNTFFGKFAKKGTRPSFCGPACGEKRTRYFFLHYLTGRAGKGWAVVTWLFW
eukprot:1514284-Prymnesium_polylepis.1